MGVENPILGGRKIREGPDRTNKIAKARGIPRGCLRRGEKKRLGGNTVLTQKKGCSRRRGGKTSWLKVRAFGSRGGKSKSEAFGGHWTRGREGAESARKIWPRASSKNDGRGVGQPRDERELGKKLESTAYQEMASSHRLRDITTRDHGGGITADRWPKKHRKKIHTRLYISRKKNRQLGLYRNDGTKGNP